MGTGASCIGEEVVEGICDGTTNAICNTLCSGGGEAVKSFIVPMGVRTIVSPPGSTPMTLAEMTPAPVSGVCVVLVVGMVAGLTEGGVDTVVALVPAVGIRALGIVVVDACGAGVALCPVVAAGRVDVLAAAFRLAIA